MYTPAEVVEVVEVVSSLPSEDLLAKMFPMEDITDWIEKNSITEQSIQVSSCIYFLCILFRGGGGGGSVR